MSAAATDAAKSIAARIVKALGGRGVFGVELMINGDEVYFADVTAHPTDSAWVTLRSQRLSAFELAARTILGLPVDTMMVSPAAARAIDAVASRDPAALTGALSVPESDLRVVGRGYRALATAPEVAAARERAGQVAAALNNRDSRLPGTSAVRPVVTSSVALHRPGLSSGMSVDRFRPALSVTVRSTAGHVCVRHVRPPRNASSCGMRSGRVGILLHDVPRLRARRGRHARRRRSRHGARTAGGGSAARISVRHLGRRDQRCGHRRRPDT